MKQKVLFLLFFSMCLGMTSCLEGGLNNVPNLENQVSFISQELSDCPFIKNLQASAAGESELKIGDESGKWSGHLKYSNESTLVSGSCVGSTQQDLQSCVDFAKSVCANSAS